MTAPSCFTFDVFLSHNSSDKVRVRRLAKRLRAAGLRVWFDEWIIKAGDDIYLAIEHGMEAAYTLVLCMSPTALKSDWVTLERSTVLFRDPSNASRRFIPLVLEDCNLPDTLRRYKYIDYRKEGRAAFAELLAACVSSDHITESVATPTDKKGVKTEKTLTLTKPVALLERKLVGHAGWVWDVAVSSNGEWAASGSADSTIKIWNLNTGECLSTLSGHGADVNCVAITPDGRQILSASDDQTIRVWDSHTRHLHRILDGQTSRVLSAVLKDGNHILTGGRDHNVRMWNIHTGQCEKEYGGHSDEVWALGTSKDGNRAVSGGFDLSMRYWDLATKECLGILKGHSNVVNSVQLTSDGRYAVSGSDDRTVRVWDLEKRTCLKTLNGHQRTIYSVAISPCGTFVASTGFLDETVRLWNLESGICFQVIENKDHASPISVTFSSDGRRLIIGTATPDIIYIYRIAMIEK